MSGSEIRRAVLEQKKEILQNRQLLTSLKKTSNGPMCLDSNDKWLSNMVCQQTIDKHTENCSNANGETTVKTKAR